MAATIVQVCPHCRTNVSRQLGFINSPILICPGCEAEVRANPRAIADNWAFNAMILGTILIWAGLGVVLMTNPDFATKYVSAYKMNPTNVRDPLALIASALIPAGLGGLALGGLAWCMGNVRGHSLMKQARRI